MSQLDYNKKMFDSECFDMDLRMHYLHKFVNNDEIIEYLLLKITEEDFHFYLS